MEAVVEFHGFKDNYNRFIVKELAVASENFQVQLVFKAPYEQNVLTERCRKTVWWLERNFHLINWGEGSVPYDEGFIRGLLKPFNSVHTKGLEKADFLREFHPNVNIIADNVVSSECTVRCTLPQHSDASKKCALRTAVGYYKTITLETW